MFASDPSLKQAQVLAPHDLISRSELTAQFLTKMRIHAIPTRHRRLRIPSSPNNVKEQTPERERAYKLAAEASQHASTRLGRLSGALDDIRAALAALDVAPLLEEPPGSG
jgi:hypothetical protein